jgi:hypothetical protein
MSDDEVGFAVNIFVPSTQASKINEEYLYMLRREYENHCLLVMKKIVDTFEECGCDRTVANGIVNAISQNMIPRVTIDFTQEKQ